LFFVTDVTQIEGYIFGQQNFLTKNGLGCILSDFSQTHPVTLVAGRHLLPRSTEGNKKMRFQTKKNKTKNAISDEKNLKIEFQL
jgi:hypothetical protein